MKLKLIDGKGEIFECEPSDDLFKAAIGGIGAVGIILEVVVQGVDRFNVEQKTEISDLFFVEDNLERLLTENDHFSLYLFPFTTKCQINIWNRTSQGQSFGGTVREFLSISMDALLAAWFGNLVAYTGLLPALSSLTHSIKKGTNLVLESNEAYNRTIYHLHQELEFTVPFEETFDACRRFIRLYEEMYAEGLPYTILESMSLGIPILASKTGGLAEVLSHRENALLVEVGDVVELASSMAELVCNPGLGRNLGRAGREKQNTELNLELMGSAYWSVYENVC